jgi:hypothetical protein
MGVHGRCRFELIEDRASRRGVSVQQVDSGHRQQLGRRHIAVLRFVDAPVGGMSVAPGGNDIEIASGDRARLLATQKGHKVRFTTAANLVMTL